MLRRDGFVSLDSGQDEGLLRTELFRLEGDSLWVNADASRGELRLRVLDADDEVLAESEVIGEDKVAHDLVWREGEIAKHQQEIVRLEFRSRHTQLFSYWIT